MLPIASWATQGLIPPTRRADAKEMEMIPLHISHRDFSPIQKTLIFLVPWLG